jgi:tetratricopeptide (TPR) repeat protein
MKNFRTKTARSPVPRSKKSDSAPTPSFYTQHADETPLDDHSEVRSPQQTARTSRHSAAYRREVSNRASNWTLALLLLRAVLIVLLLVGGFIVLKLVLNRMNEPSEKEQRQWEANAAQMEKSGTEAPVPQELVVSAEQIDQRLEQWKQTERLLRSAEALMLRGINEEAAQRLERALRVTPGNRAARQMLIDIYMQLGHSAEAVPLCIGLMDQDGPTPELEMKLLQALQASGQIKAGLVLANRILQDQPNNEMVLEIAAAGQMQEGNTDAALAMFQKMLGNSPTNTAALEQCGKIYFDRGDYEKAISDYLMLVRQDSRPDYYQMLAHSYAQQNEAGKAVVLMGQAASLFGGGQISPWLKDPELDPIRESVEFRSFADRLVGVETRKAIEAINKREAEKTTPAAVPGGIQLPQQPDLNALRSGK